jgi:UDP-glucose 4-epimerase
MPRPPGAILITGSAGHLGEALMRSLRGQGRRAIGVDIKPSPFTDRVGSICDRSFIERCMEGVGTVIHAATLHKPHVATHSDQDFVDTNVTGTLVLLEAARAARVDAFIFTSTTSAFGASLAGAPGEPATWVTEELGAIPRNIYGVTKLMAESLCELFSRREHFAVLVLRTSRFFPEEDDDPAVSKRYQIANVQANEMLYRRVDIEDVVSAHLLAVEKAAALGFRRYVISATSPFTQGDLAALRRDAAAVVRRLFADYEALFAAREWSMFPQIDRVYVNRLAVTELGWQPRYDFRHVLECLRAHRDFRSPLARAVGSKGYHVRG